MKVKIIRGIEAAGKFPFGFLSKENKEFLENNVGEVFVAVRENINCYKLENGHSVHIYNAFELA